jgi:hypothetical protein
MGVQAHDWAIWTEAWDPTSLTWNLHKIFFELLEAHF